SLRIADWFQIGGSNSSLFQDLHRLYPDPAAWHPLRGIAVKLDFFGLRQQIRKVVLVGPTEMSEVIPAPRHIGTHVENNDALVERVSRFVRHDGSHHAADELN